MDTTNKEDNIMSSDCENWVMVNSCDAAEEAITLNKTTESDNESESSISIISRVTTPNESHSDEETVPDRELPEEIENLSTSTRSSIEKIEISDEESHLLQNKVTCQLPLINISEVIDPPETDEFLNGDQILENRDNKDKENDKPELLTETKKVVIEDRTDKRPVPLICPKIIIQNAEKISEYDDEETVTIEQTAIEENESISNKESLNKIIEEHTEESNIEINLYQSSYQAMQYDLPPTVDDSDSWTDNDSSSDTMNENNQIATISSLHPHRQEGIATSQNGLFLGAMFFFATALIKLYLLKDNVDLPDQNAFSYELDKLKEQYQSVDTHYNSYIDDPNEANLETIVQFCTAKHGSNEDPFHRSNYKVERCINKRMKKIKNEENTIKKKIELDIREKLLEIREKELQKREQELLDRLLSERYQQNLKEKKIVEMTAKLVYKGSEKQFYRKNADSLKELRKDNAKFKKKHKLNSAENSVREKFYKAQNGKHFSSTQKNPKENKAYDRIDNIYADDEENDYVRITNKYDPIDELAKKISGAEIFDNNNVVTFKEIALALREKELVRKLQEYNNNLENRINNIAILNQPKQLNITEDNTQNRKYNTAQEKTNNYTKEYKKKKDKKYPKKDKYENQKGQFNNKKREFFSEEAFQPFQRQGKANQKEYYNNKYNSKEKENNFNEKKIKEKFKAEKKYFKKFNKGPDETRKKSIEFNYKKNKYYEKHDPKDELYIKYNPLKDTIDIVNISRNEDKSFILLENSNKTVNGQWYINLHHARSMLRSNEKSADWYFDRVLYRELKRNKAKWYFDYMSGRQNTRECFI